MRIMIMPRLCVTISVIFVFQAEDGIRDVAVTGVQTCALPISGEQPETRAHRAHSARKGRPTMTAVAPWLTATVYFADVDRLPRDRKSTRLNSSHGYISYAVFCLKKKKTKKCRRASTSAATPPC